MPEQDVKISVVEQGGNKAGSIMAILEAPGEPTITKSGSGTARIFTTLLSNTTYTLTVDNGKVGSPEYTVTIIDDN